MTESIYYNNLDPTDGTVDRVYCLQFSIFCDQDWSTLSEAYKTLPGWAGALVDGCPCWYGLPESEEFLVASVEPSGLQVFGTLSSDKLQEWHAAFIRAISSLPTFEV